ncbi:uncharacterized protein EI90DRAFT_3144233 [Cantharellus anzutake]|uniref:uncharacterized protein n=1 Tax=Cantharellus anzutake TaxID=1750568 RepID=UPI00190519CB|nr:uncharacterized protein EI90DRAFT_3144233 [Cantharellus anzutake]KAF8339013.1 hypothetical protein EI90DRAFT_3144233 [Cantharellus anzutake]
MSNGGAEDQVSLVSSRSINPSADTITKIVRRIRALTLKLLPLEVESDVLNDPTSTVLTSDFLRRLRRCAFQPPRWLFIWDADHNPADYGENMGRAAACEILARRVVHTYDSDRLNAIMSKRYKHLEWDGDESSLASALELAIDQHCTIFLSSSESQFVVNSLWRGDWVQRNNPDHEIYCHRHLDPSRLGVPRYQSWFRMLIWVFFLLFTLMLHSANSLQSFDPWEVILYFMTLAYTIEGEFMSTHCNQIYKIFRFFTWKVLGFWNMISLLTDALLVAAFSLRVAGLANSNSDQQASHKLKSFQILACVAPLIWMKLITVLDGFKYVGTMQICVSRMLQESGIFLALLSILGIGFAQSLYALDAADGHTEHGSLVFNTLIQALLQWSATVTVILLNILISLFSSAYDDVTKDAAAEYLAFFEMIRAPDDYVFPAPFNLIEGIFVVPFEPMLSKQDYAKLSRTVMLITFWPVLFSIHLFETHLDFKTNRYFRQFFMVGDDGEEDDPTVQDPAVEGEEGDLQISRVPFEKLLSYFPNTHQSTEAAIIGEIRALREKVEELVRIAAREGKVD